MSMSQLNVSRSSRGFQKMQRPFNMSMASINPNTTRESFNVEMRSFMSKRRISRIAWWSFIFLTIANFITLLTSLAPGWAWTREVNGEFATAGEYYGLYGIWYICWESTDGYGSRVCELIRRLDIPDPGAFVKSVQALSLMTVIAGFICFITLGAYMCVPVLNYSQKVLQGYIAASSIAAILNVALFTTYCVSFLVRAYWCCDVTVIQRELISYGLTYCFGLSCIGAVAFIVSAVFASCEVTSMKRERRLARKIRRTGLRHYDSEHMIIDPKMFVDYNPHMMR